mgnify:CR=1 FL=1
MKKSILSLVITVALAGIANAGSVVFSNFGAPFTQVQADGVAIPAGSGFVAVGTTADTAGDLQLLQADLIANNGSMSIAARDLLASKFIQFGDAVQFGFNGNAGFFQGNAQDDGGAADFNGRDIIMVAGNGATLADSTGLLIVQGDTFGPDAPVFSSNVGPDNGTVLFGAAGGVNTFGATFPAMQMGDVIPEPGVSILALFSAGLLVLRRRR